jgi:hypothetical protein
VTASDVVVAIRRLSLLAVIGGLALVIGAVLWWGYFYRAIGLGSTVSCLYASGGTCDFIRHVAAEAGRRAYSPTAFRLAVVLLTGGSVVRIAVALWAGALKQ